MYLIRSAKILLLVCFVSSCSSPEPTIKSTRVASEAQLSDKGVHHYVSKLAAQLLMINPVALSADRRQSGAFQNSLLMDKKIAVGTFLPIEMLEKDAADVSELQLGLQVQDSLQSLLVQQGLQVVEFKLTNDIYLRNNQDKVLTRELAQLESVHEVEYYLTGTLLRQEDAYVVNAKLVNVKSKQVVAAATEYIPDNTLWASKKVKMKRNKLYRMAY